MKISLSGVLLSLVMYTFSFQINAATVTLDSSGLLNIPSVQVGTTNYTVDLQLIAGSSPSTFELGSNILITLQTPDAQYQNNNLSIPEVAYGSDKYSAELILVEGSSPLRFQLSSATMLCSNCVSNTQEITSVSGLTYNFSESTPGFGTTTGTIQFKSDGTFVDDATNDGGHFIATGSWAQSGDEVTIHFTYYQYDGQAGVTYNGDTLVGQIQNNLATLTNGNTIMNLTSLVNH